MTARDPVDRHDVVECARGLPGARSATIKGSESLPVDDGLIVVAEGTLDAFFVALDEDGQPLTPAFVCQLGRGDLVPGGWWTASDLGLPAGRGSLRAVGEAKVVRAPGGSEPPGPLAEALAEWERSAREFAASSSARRQSDAQDLLARRRSLDEGLATESQRALLRVFEFEALAKRPLSLPPLAAALADAANAAGIEIEGRALESVAGDVGAESDVTELAARLRVPVRPVTLHGRWWKGYGQPLLAFREGRPVAILPSRRGYVAQDPTGVSEPVSARLAGEVEPGAYAVYPKLAERPATVRELMRVGFLRERRLGLALIGLTAILAAFGVFTPYATAQIVGSIVPSGREGALYDMLIAVGTFTVAFGACSVAQGLAVLALSSRAGAGLTAAIWHRLVHLPPSFFRGRASGVIAQQATAVDQMRLLIGSSLVAGLVGSALSLAAIALLIAYSPPIALIVIVLVAGALTVGVAIMRGESRWLRAVVDERNRLNGLLLGLFSGISKLRVAGAERRAHALWRSGYAFQQEAQRNASLQVVRITVLQGLLAGLLLLGILLAVWIFQSGGASLTDFTGTVAASGQLAAAAGAMLAVGSTAIQLPPLYRSARPILDATPEVRAAAMAPGDLAGDIRLDDVTFGYEQDSPVLDGVSLHATPGSFVAIVGPSGAGKSTILRLILGFEDPWSGEVLLDGKVLDRLDLEAVRRRMGTVIQDARITAGSILTNILGTLPLKSDAAWEAAEMAGIADDIRAMPMQMSTVVSEGGSGFSGGQLQRLLLARALVRKPKILLLDEATSALDNETQQVVGERLAQLGVTRIVVAHRVSTVRWADHIVVLERGRVVEDGSFDELMKADGLFASLAKRQLL